ncbi:MAG: hypothetical protein JXB05_15960 [Myxococcaceae bacterium]|nr:hypothetical protein [Myxococcaceae bacterium]
MKPFILSFLAGLVLASVAVAGVAFFALSPRIREVRQEWALTPVLVMAQDLSAGEQITYDVLSQRAIPARFVTDSMVRPEEAPSLIKRPLPLALKAGDILLWGMFADHSAPDACFAAISPKVHAAGQTARDEAISRFGERMGDPLPTPDPVPVLKADASGEISVVVAAAEIPEGKVIDASLLTVGKFPSYMLTSSFVPAEQLRELVGTRAVLPIQAKDALMWQLLDHAERPKRVITCMSEAGAAKSEARKRTMSEEAAAFVRGQEKP